MCAVPDKSNLRTIQRVLPCVAAALLLATLTTSVGCFDAEGMIKSRRAAANRARLEEVDLGEYRVSVPRVGDRSPGGELYFHVFGLVANQDMKTVQEVLEQHGPEIRHVLLLASRNLSPEELQDPRLSVLRESVAQAVNANLDGEPVRSVGFYQFGFSLL